MPYSSKAIANFFLDLAGSSGKPLKQMKLQKLVYFAHGWSLGLSGGPLINEVVQAWSYGPVILSLYKAFRDFGSNDITEKAVEYVQGGDFFEFETRTPAVDDYPHGDSIQPFLRKIWEVYGGFTGVQLSNLTHAAGTPWHQVASKYEGGTIPKYETIPDDIIAEYFRKEARRNEQANS